MKMVLRLSPPVGGKYLKTSRKCNLSLKPYLVARYSKKKNYPRDFDTRDQGVSRFFV